MTFLTPVNTGRQHVITRQHVTRSISGIAARKSVSCDVILIAKKQTRRVSNVSCGKVEAYGENEWILQRDK